jgi:hypothetical protein
MATSNVLKTTIGGTCLKCRGTGKMEDRVTLKRLAALMANPDDAERQLFGSFAP